jgi:ribonuclease G
VAEILYTVSPDLHRMVRLERGKVVELDFEIPEQSTSMLGAIYYGRVIEIQKPLSAAFVDIGEKRLGMLPLREGKLDPIKQGDGVLVQVSRTENPLEEKGVRLTRLITLALGPLLYTPFTVGLSLSKKLKEKEIFKGLFPISPKEGLVIRHWASAQDPLKDWFFQLRAEWAALLEKPLEKAPVCLSPGPDLLTRILRSLSLVDTLTVDDRSISTRSQGRGVYVREQTFNEPCEDAWESLFSPEISLAKGGSLYIEETRGLTVIDVNSHGALRHSLSFNREAVGEALKQIHLRELGGKIVIDLIGAPKDANLLLQGNFIPSDLQIWGISPMGLLEMIRRRRRLSLPQRLKLQLN